MKRNVVFIAVVLLTTLTTMAQNIAVVNPKNETTIYQTLDDAIAGADAGSIVYLPGGGLQIGNETKINKKLTFMGVSHRGDTDNADGATVIAGNFNFEKGSDGSAVIGAYISGDIIVGTTTDSVTNLTIRFCNANCISVKHKQSSGLVVNQCYLRAFSNFGDCNVRLENNIMHSISNLKGAVINHNIITSNTGNYYMYAINSYDAASLITNNIILNPGRNFGVSSGNILNNCIGKGTWGDNPIQLSDDQTWEDVFEKYDSKHPVSIACNYRIKKTWTNAQGAGTDGTDIGIYGGSDFKDKDEAHAPIPRIVSKKVAEQTDGSGRLHIEVTVKSK